MEEKKGRGVFFGQPVRILTIVVTLLSVMIFSGCAAMLITLSANGMDLDQVLSRPTEKKLRDHAAVRLQCGGIYEPGVSGGGIRKAISYGWRTGPEKDGGYYGSGGSVRGSERRYLLYS